MDVYRASTSSTPIYDVPLRATPTLAEWTPVSPDEAGEGNAGTFIPVHNAFVQQVADLRLFSDGI